MRPTSMNEADRVFSSRVAPGSGRNTREEHELGAHPEHRRRHVSKTKQSSSRGTGSNPSPHCVGGAHLQASMSSGP